MYVERDADDNIVGAFTVAQPGFAEEFLSADDPALLAFLQQ